jgi:hypothetical protein
VSRRGAFTLAEIAAKLTTLEVACSRCERRGRLSLARLIEQHGAEASLGDLREVIAQGCPRLVATSVYDRCGGALQTALSRGLLAIKPRWHPSVVLLNGCYPA